MTSEVRLVAGPSHPPAARRSCALAVGDVVRWPAEWPGAELVVAEIDEHGCEESGWAPLIWVPLPDGDRTWAVESELELIRPAPRPS